MLNLDDDDFLGRAQIEIDDPSVRDQTTDKEVDANGIPKPHWHKIRAGFHKNLPVCGEILCSFVLTDDDFDYKFKNLDEVPIKDEIEVKDFNIDINVLGLRDL